MSMAQVMLEIGTGPVLVGCALTWIRARRTPGRRPQADHVNNAWADRGEFPRLGIRIRRDGFVYTWRTNRCQDQLAGATASVAPIPATGRGKPRLARVTILFANGGSFACRVSIRDLAPVRKEVERFNRLSQPAGNLPGFVRTNPAVQRP